VLLCCALVIVGGLDLDRSHVVLLSGTMGVVEGPDRSQQIVCAVSEGEVGLAVLEERGAIGFPRVEVNNVPVG
jgi:hypothetical protein